MLIQILAKLAVLFVVSFFHIWISCNINWYWNHKSRISWHFHQHPFVFLGCNVGRVIDTNIVLEISKNLSRNFVKNLLGDFVNKFVSTLRKPVDCWWKCCWSLWSSQTRRSLVLVPLHFVIVAAILFHGMMISDAPSCCCIIIHRIHLWNCWRKIVK